LTLQRHFAGGLAGCLALALAGCAGGPVPVEGKVTMNGKPVAGATVVFIPERGGPEAGAQTDNEGNFQLTGTKTEGITPGEYRVTVSKMEWPPGVTPPDPTKMSFPSVLSKRQTVPLKYTVQDKTPLRVTVPNGGTKDVHLALER
jgi:Carboxypeptidase regulatory-like domain